MITRILNYILESTEYEITNLNVFILFILTYLFYLSLALLWTLSGEELLQNKVIEWFSRGVQALYKLSVCFQSFWIFLLH